MFCEKFDDFIAEFGFDYDVVATLYNHYYFDDDTVNNILGIYDKYLADKIDWDCAFDIVQEEEHLFRDICLGEFQEITSFTPKEFIQEFDLREINGLDFNKKGLTEDEIVERFKEVIMLDEDIDILHDFDNCIVVVE